MMKVNLRLCLTVVLFLSPEVSLALGPEEAVNKAVAQFAKLKVPGKGAHEFEKWTYDISGFTVLHCWHFVKKKGPFPKLLEDFKVTAAGTWTSPVKQKSLKLCQSIAEKGIDPICTHSTLWVKNVKRQRDFPLDYLQVYKNKPIEIEGNLGCYLNADQIDKQNYIGPVSARELLSYITV
jgi:hypothetical protein